MELRIRAGQDSRMYGLDLLRIFSMLGIIGLHLFNAGGILTAAQGVGNMLLTGAMAIFCYASVNIFAMLTGFLYAGRQKMSATGLVNLLLTVLFYCVVITGVFICILPATMLGDKALIVKALFPPFAGRFWYITAYVLLFLLIPYLNMALAVMSKRQFRTLLGILFFLLSVVSTFGLRDYFQISDGYSPFWLIVCYLFGAYIKLHGHIFSLKKAGKVVILLANIAVITAVAYFGKYHGIVARLFSYTSPFTVLNAIFLLELFRDISVKGALFKRIVLSLSGAAFGVYIIHAHILVLDFVLTDAFAALGRQNIMVCFLGILASLFGIYLICWVVDLLRGGLFKLMQIDKLSNVLGRRLNTLLKWNDTTEK